MASSTSAYAKRSLKRTASRLRSVDGAVGTATSPYLKQWPTLTQQHPQHQPAIAYHLTLHNTIQHELQSCCAIARHADAAQTTTRAVGALAYAPSHSSSSSSSSSRAWHQHTAQLRRCQRTSSLICSGQVAVIVLGADKHHVQAVLAFKYCMCACITCVLTER
jgi:hypothetical protein